METEKTAAQQPIYSEQDPVWLAACQSLGESLLKGEISKATWEGLDPKTRASVAAYAVLLITNETPQVVYELLNGLREVIDPDAPPKSVALDAVWDGEHIHTFGKNCAMWNLPAAAAEFLGSKGATLQIEIKKMG